MIWILERKDSSVEGSVFGDRLLTESLVPFISFTFFVDFHWEVFIEHDLFSLF